MSLAKDLPQSYLGSLNRPAAPKLARASLSDLAARTVTPEMRSSQRSASAPSQAAVEEPAVVAMPRRTERQTSSDTSFDLIDRASKGMAMILNRYKQLEEHVKQVDSWSNAQIQAAESEAARWQDAAHAAETRLAECQRNLEIMMQRVEAAEAAMHRDKEALTVLQERIIQAFGFGSDAHEAIAAGLQMD